MAQTTWLTDFHLEHTPEGSRVRLIEAYDNALSYASRGWGELYTQHLHLLCIPFNVTSWGYTMDAAALSCLVSCKLSCMWIELIYGALVATTMLKPLPDQLANVYNQNNIIHALLLVVYLHMHMRFDGR